MAPTLKNNINVKCIDETLGGASVTYKDIGNHCIGRGSFEQLQEKKCSRKQITITINNDNTVFISSTGINPSYLKKSDQEYFVQMIRDQNYVLEDGDCFSLLFELYTFLVTFQPTTTTITNTSLTDDRKRKQIDNDNNVQNDRHHDNSNNNEFEDNKKKKIDINTNSKKQCPHGASCYRKNPDHLKEFDHINTKQTQITPQQTPQPINDKPTIQIIKKSPDIVKQQVKIDDNNNNNNNSATVTTTATVVKTTTSSNTVNETFDENNNTNISKIIGAKYKKKKLSDALKERSLAFPFISTSTFGFNVEKATDIAAKAIQEYLHFHDKEDDIKLKMMVEKSIYSDKLIQSFKNKFNDKWDKRFEIIKIDNSNPIEQFNNLGCKLFATETTWRLKKTPQNKQLYELLNSSQFEKETKTRFPNTGKIGKVYPIPLSSNLNNCILHKEYGIDIVILLIGPNMNPLKPDAFKENSELVEPLLLETYHSLFNALDNF